LAAEFLQKAFDRGIPQPKFVGPSAIGAIAFQWDTPGYRLKVRVFSGRGQVCHFEWIQLPDSVEEGHDDIDAAVDRLSGFFGEGLR